MILLAKFNLMFGADIQKALLDMLLSMLSAIPRFITAAIILIIGYVFGKMVMKLFSKAIEKSGINKFGEQLNNIDILAKNNISIKISTVLGKMVYYCIMLIFVMTAVGALDMPVLADLIQNFIIFIPNLIAAFIILLGGLLLADTLKNIVHATCKSLGMPSANIIASFVFYFIFVNVIIVALSQAKINTEFFGQNISIIIAGGVLAFSIGYGFASKDLVASFLASYYTKDKLNVGDKVTLNGVTGTISNVDKSSVTIRSENKSVIIPLNKILQDNIEIHL
ncbi:MAG: mechanosensitive ion channel [Saprospiraceae bacterium]|jgi:preprotein translocase subunit YajC/fumarate reductase subunit C|nr:mechanosensitive ion channel [Saprospiraceae bacterium]MBP6446001.1 mechanosensitive ion channel [Saprospiraceae bacterium]